MDLSYFTPRVLTGVINLRPVKHDLFTRFFRPLDPKPVDVLELQTSLRGASILPAITNYAAGTMRKGEVLSVDYVKAPRFRPKRAFRAADLLKTQKGFSPYDPRVNPVERAIAEDMDANRDDIDRMVEIMCAQAAVDGRIDLYDMIEGQVVKNYTVDFKRPASHVVALTGEALWSNPASDLAGMMETWNLLIQEDTSGHSATDLILGKNAWTAFRRHPDVKDSLDNRRIDIGQLSPRVGAKLKGQWNGLNIWTHNATYNDLEGNTKYYLEPDYALLLAGSAESVIEFGQPVDVKCEGPAKIFAKQFEQEDPSGVFTIAESRPLPMTRHCGWTVKIKAV
ncbi:major capsid protein [Desulfovibrio sp. ZJ200]|uniref:major capsid protein n=1 Tax=Desulfovibrio sp. ZJ200 TaxID=2709792 RepID=UPI0013ED24EE|nr:major capsid protein [Desulfovibrio sp. ZJ200]